MLVTVKARVHTDATGTYTELPAQLTPAGVLEPLLLDYCLYRSHDRSLAWMSKVARSVRMFLEYLQSNPAERDTFVCSRTSPGGYTPAPSTVQPALTPVACAGHRARRRTPRTSSPI
jgi:hypothetical protein